MKFVEARIIEVPDDEWENVKQVLEENGRPAEFADIAKEMMFSLGACVLASEYQEVTCQC